MKHGFVYRFFVLLLVFAILGVVLFIVFNYSPITRIIVVCAAAGGFVITETVNEIIIHHKNKNKEGENVDSGDQ